jgi:UDP-N-acetylmuramoyl-tripeptide--D-alanyl-D-alanine ligase
VEISLPVPGKHNISNALAACACAYILGAELSDMQQGLSNFASVKGRLQVLEGKQGAVLIDDSYNANPGSMRTAIDVLSQYPGQRILVTGDMAELGEDAPKHHEKIGMYTREKGIDRLFATGTYAGNTAAGFGEGAAAFATQGELKLALLPHLNPDAVVLVKGSRSSGMDCVVATLQAEPPNGQEL